MTLPNATNTFATFVARDVFSALNGFVLCNASGLDRHQGGTARGLDLLRLYSTKDEEDPVTAVFADMRTELHFTNTELSAR
jgi:hypothetical protein